MLTSVTILKYTNEHQKVTLCAPTNMSPSTTLITFRIRAPRSTRTLKLYGSWDNFTIPYPMNKDLQTGSEYWHGCFNFTNIICDGKPGETIRSRSGGLKMGGTYWYYYKIDDETDFHNVCERATTNCPLLPGQLVNVLHVPYALSGNRSRNPSTSSTSSERRTMNPGDKFMNPRPAPSKPDTLRVRTSPVLADFAQTKDDLQAPAKETPNASRFLRLAKKGSVDSYSTNTSSTPLAGGLRAAFRLRTARSQSPEPTSEGASSRHRRAVSTERNYDSREENRINDPFQRPHRGLLLRTASEEAVPNLSFGQHRRQRSISQEASSNRVPDMRNLPRQIEKLTLAQPRHQPLGTLAETLPNEDAQLDDLSMEHVKAELDLEKRLPTLPNTPSSAYPVSMIETSPPKHTMLPLDLLDSHFSSTTIDSEPNLLSMVLNQQSHFSAWTTTTDTSSVFVDTSVPLPELRHQRDSFTALSKQMTESPNDTFLSSALSYASICSSLSTTPSTSFLDVDAEFEAAQLAMGHPSQVPQYSLPECDYSSQTTLKALSKGSERGRSGNPSIAALSQPVECDPRSSEIVHSESMQRLLDELSYLSGMIQH